MALSRPALNYFRTFAPTRTFATTGARMSAGGATGKENCFNFLFSPIMTISTSDGSSYKMWKMMTFFVCFPVIGLATFINLGPTAEHHHRPDFAAYEYMRIRGRVRAYDFISRNCRLHQLIPLLAFPLG